MQQKKCQGCKQLLTLPSVHFLCGHSYHKVGARAASRAELRRSVGEGVSALHAALPVGLARRRERRKDFAQAPAPTEEEYFEEMATATDGFEVNAEFIGRRLFSKPAPPVVKSKLADCE